MFKRKHKGPQKQSDAFLIDSYIKFDDMAYLARLFKRYSHLLFGLCMKYLKNEDDSKDAVMQIFEKLIIDLKKYEVRYFKSWIYTYTKNHCFGILRKRQKQNAKQRDYFYENRNNSVENEFIFHHNDKKEEKLIAIEAALKQLKPEQKECLELFYFNENSYFEITEKTNYSLKAVKSHVQNGKRMLKKILDEELIIKKYET